MVFEVIILFFPQQMAVLINLLADRTKCLLKYLCDLHDKHLCMLTMTQFVGEGLPYEKGLLTQKIITGDSFDLLRIGTS